MSLKLNASKIALYAILLCCSPGSVQVFLTFVHATASVCMTCG